MRTILMPWMTTACLWVLLSSGVLLALNPPTVLEPAVLLDGQSKDRGKSEIRYYGQPARNGIIDLTASNGFFDRCFEAIDPQPTLPGDERFIRGSFGYLQRLSDKVAGTARWHLWCAEAGEIRATFFLKVPKADAGHEWVIRVGDDTRTLKAAENDGESAQEQQLKFKVKQPGKVRFTIDCTKAPPPAQSRLYYVRLEGTAIQTASLLRTRWRPPAVHTHFYAPKECLGSGMWVFETRAVSEVSSYSPLTTLFGYFGTSFNDGGRIAPGAGFNFSMWIAGRGAKAAPSIERMPRLIGSAIPDARFATWGGEGTGVRPRAVAYPDGAVRTIQALRIEATDDGLLTFFGYFFDERDSRWKLYVSAQKPAKNAKVANSPDFGTMRGTGSFCEIPGPPNRERSGDLVREIKRRGWFFGNDQKWYRAVLGDALKESPVPADENEDGPITNKRTYYVDNYAKDGWISMSTGGVEYHAAADQRRKPPEEGEASPLPAYLGSEKVKQLFELPVEFGESNVSNVGSDAATIEYELKKTGPNSKAILYYGTVDSLTYPAQQVTSGSAVEIDMFRPDRTWQFATPEQKVAAGTNQFQLSALKGNTTYYYRLFATHDEGKSWDYHSSSFKTK